MFAHPGSVCRCVGHPCALHTPCACYTHRLCRARQAHVVTPELLERHSSLSRPVGHHRGEGVDGTQPRKHQTVPVHISGAMNDGVPAVAKIVSLFSQWRAEPKSEILTCADDVRIRLSICGRWKVERRSESPRVCTCQSLGIDRCWCCRMYAGTECMQAHSSLHCYDTITCGVCSHALVLAVAAQLLCERAPRYDHQRSGRGLEAPELIRS